MVDSDHFSRLHVFDTRLSVRHTDPVCSTSCHADQFPSGDVPLGAPSVESLAVLLRGLRSEVSHRLLQVLQSWLGGCGLEGHETWGPVRDSVFLWGEMCTPKSNW